MSSDKKVLPFPTSEALEAEATEWIVRLDGDSVSDDDLRLFEEWRAQSEKHERAYKHAAALWGTLDGLNTLQFVKASGLTRPTLLERIGLEVKHRIAAMMGLAAAAAVSVTLVVSPALLMPSAETPQVHRTVVGTQKTVLLDDGSELLLNTDSKVEVEFAQNSRTVRLLKGEVHFTVFPDKARPFSVHVDHRIVTAVGTAFTVRREARTIEVTVTEGDVNLFVMPETRAARQDVSASANADPLANLTAGENAVIGETVERVNVIPPPEINRKLAWRQGLLAFSGEPLSDVVTEVSRYTDIEIVIGDPELRDLRFGGFLKVGNVDTLFNALEQSFGVKVERDGTSVVYLSLAET